MVFDKTGTLTEDGLQILGIQTVDTLTKFRDFVQSINDLLSNELVERVREYFMDKRVLFNEAMASCHSITYINEELVGDPLEIKMFENTNWILDETNNVSNSLIGQNDLVLAYVRPKTDAGYRTKKIL